MGDSELRSPDAQCRTVNPEGGGEYLMLYRGHADTGDHHSILELVRSIIPTSGYQMKLLNHGNFIGENASPCTWSLSCRLLMASDIDQIADDKIANHFANHVNNAGNVLLFCDPHNDAHKPLKILNFIKSSVGDGNISPGRIEQLEGTFRKFSKNQPLSLGDSESVDQSDSWENFGLIRSADGVPCLYLRHDNGGTVAFVGAPIDKIGENTWRELLTLMNINHH